MAEKEEVTELSVKNFDSKIWTSVKDSKTYIMNY